jgi:hypothetical protein
MVDESNSVSAEITPPSYFNENLFEVSINGTQYTYSGGIRLEGESTLNKTKAKLNKIINNTLSLLKRSLKTNYNDYEYGKLSIKTWKEDANDEMFTTDLEIGNESCPIGSGETKEKSILAAIKNLENFEIYE